jgi:hypothetical protein
MIPPWFARALQHCTSCIGVPFRLTFQEVMPISKTRNQLYVTMRPAIRRARDTVSPLLFKAFTPTYPLPLSRKTADVYVRRVLNVALPTSRASSIFISIPLCCGVVICHACRWASSQKKFMTGQRTSATQPLSCSENQTTRVEGQTPCSKLSAMSIEFISIKSLAATGSNAPGSCVGHSRVPSPDREHPPSTNECGPSRYDSA